MSEELDDLEKELKAQGAAIFDLRGALNVHIARSEGHSKEILLTIENLKLQVSHTAEVRLDRLERSIADHVVDCSKEADERKKEREATRQRRFSLWAAIIGAWVAALGPIILSLAVRSGGL